ncbi:DUF4262 domain-containing protein [Bacillus testis]|uniref:DUF4262 domain-containing protein n=1 Tax=Bacillus testis TaxID=1622072 RepID=UPI00067F186E|nr:DUF4262 domain-containing protein [Bacillus testis]
MEEKIVLTEEQQRLLDKQGWFYEYKEVDKPLADIATRGMRENLNHEDLQIVLAIGKEMAELILDTVIANIKDGYKYREGLWNNVIEDTVVEFKRVRSGDRSLLRLVLPDSEGRFPEDEGCQYPYCEQYKAID